MRWTGELKLALGFGEVFDGGNIEKAGFLLAMVKAPKQRLEWKKTSLLIGQRSWLGFVLLRSQLWERRQDWESCLR